MTTSALVLLASLGTALAQPWGKPWGWGQAVAPLSPCYYSADLCDCVPGTSFAVSHTTQTIGSKTADFKNVSGQCK